MISSIVREEAKAAAIEEWQRLAPSSGRYSRYVIGRVVEAALVVVERAIRRDGIAPVIDITSREIR